MAHPNVTIVDHALVQHKLTIMRDRQVSFPKFRRLAYEIGLVIGAEAMRDLALLPKLVETPILDAAGTPAVAEGATLLNPDLVIIPILRAGLVMAEALHELVPTARGGHVGLFRDQESNDIVKYLVSIPFAPASKSTTDFIVVDPMIATGQTARRAVSILQEQGIESSQIKIVGLIASDQGLNHFYDDYNNADVKIFIGSIESNINDKGFIVPGLGDSGDRQFGTEKPIFNKDKSAERLI